MGTIKKTLFFGGLLSAGLVWLTGTKKGKEVRDQLLDQAADIYVNLKKNVRKIDKQYNISKSQYTKMAKDTVNEYFEKHPVPDAIKSVVQKIVLSQWETFKEEVGIRASETKRAAKSAFRKAAPKKRK